MPSPRRAHSAIINDQSVCLVAHFRGVDAPGAPAATENTENAENTEN
ncbi:MAG: hypothetical protein ABIR83_11260 [Nakamurella sp.]